MLFEHYHSKEFRSERRCIGIPFQLLLEVSESAALYQLSHKFLILFLLQLKVSVTVTPAQFEPTDAFIADGMRLHTVSSPPGRLPT